ncbi:DNA methyltransferase [Prosthecobacter sp.]|uniref:DNA methyltransferase n=1 Tax=Prosthecobacter sp. TaxID=1965333 RepID=UPI00378330FF
MSPTLSDTMLGGPVGQNILVLCDAAVLIERVPSGAVELCYIDPPLFPHIDEAAAQESTRIMRDHLLALAKVLQQARRCLTSTGNIFVHSEPEMNGSIRLLLDQVFGRQNFCQEIIVPRPTPRTRGGLPAGHDTVFHFRVGSEFVFNAQMRALTPEETARQFSKSDARGPFRLMSLVSPISRPSLAFEWEGEMPPKGNSWRFSRERLEQFHADGKIVMGPPGSPPRLKQYASEAAAGIDIGTVWDDLPLSLTAGERADYPTQKPELLLERLIKMGSNKGGLVLDPFCGSGTTLMAASKCGRRWIGGDNSSQAIAVATQRLHQTCALMQGRDFHSTNEMRLKEGSAPQAVPLIRIATGFDDFIAGPVRSFVRGQPLEIEETRTYEFKEVRPDSKLSDIADVAEKYAVAFLNSEGGRIFWGVRGSDRIVLGTKLTFDARDRLRQNITSKLGAIRPAIDPTAFRLEIHLVEDPGGETDLVVVELFVPLIKSSAPYFAGGVDAFVRLDGVTRKLAGPELYEWIVRRMSNL